MPCARTGMNCNQVSRNTRRHSPEDVVSADHQTPHNSLKRSRGFRVKQDSNPCRSGCLSNPIRIIASGDGGGINLFAEDVGECFDASRPFAGQFLFAAMRHPSGMRKRMAADHVTLSSQEANLLRVQEALLSNLTGGDKKMPAPASISREGPRRTWRRFPRRRRRSEGKEASHRLYLRGACAVGDGVRTLAMAARWASNSARLNLYFAVPGPVKPLIPQSALSTTS